MSSSRTSCRQNSFLNWFCAMERPWWDQWQVNTKWQVENEYEVTNETNFCQHNDICTPMPDSGLRLCFFCLMIYLDRLKGILLMIPICSNCFNNGRLRFVIQKPNDPQKWSSTSEPCNTTFPTRPQAVLPYVCTSLNAITLPKAFVH